MTPYPMAAPSEPPPECSPASSVSMGSHAAEKTSHTRNSRMPMAVALRKTFREGEAPRMRPTGSPMRIVAPAMNPSNRVADRLTDGS